MPRLDHLYAGERRAESGMPDGLGDPDSDGDPTPQDETSPASVAMKGLPAPPAEDGAAASARVGWPTAAWSGQSAAAAALGAPGPATASVDGESAPSKPVPSLPGSAGAAVRTPAVARDAGLFYERLLAGVVPRQASHLGWPRYATYAAREFSDGFDDSSRPLVSGAAGIEPLRQLGWLATDPATARTAAGWLIVAADDPARAVDEAWAGNTNMLDKEFGGPQWRLPAQRRQPARLGGGRQPRHLPRPVLNAWDGFAAELGAATQHAVDWLTSTANDPGAPLDVLRGTPSRPGTPARGTSPTSPTSPTSRWTP